MTSVAADGRHRSMVHRVSREALRRIRVAAAALDRAGRNMRGRCHPRRRCAVMTGDAICIRRLVYVRATRPARIRRGSRRVASDAILATCRNVTGIRCGSVRTFGSLTGVDAVVARVAAAAGHGRMVHGVGGEARRRIGVAIAALDSPGRNVRRCCHSGCRRAVVASRAVRIRDLVDVSAAGPAGEVSRGGGMTRDAVASAGRDMTGIGRGTLRTLRAFAGIRA
jgi:hypothetical protein